MCVCLPASINIRLEIWPLPRGKEKRIKKKTRFNLLAFMKNLRGGIEREKWEECRRRVRSLKFYNVRASLLFYFKRVILL